MFHEETTFLVAVEIIAGDLVIPAPFTVYATVHEYPISTTTAPTRYSGSLNGSDLVLGHIAVVCPDHMNPMGGLAGVTTIMYITLSYRVVVYIISKGAIT